MIYIVCTKCNTALRVADADTSILDALILNGEWHPNSYPCPAAGCGGVAKYCDSIDSLALRTLTLYNVTPEEAFTALMGVGLPDEKDCGETAVRDALLTKKITSCAVKQIRGMNRSTVEWVEFEDGSRIYLAAAKEGAVAYRLSHKRRHVEEVLNENTPP